MPLNGVVFWETFFAPCHLVWISNMFYLTLTFSLKSKSYVLYCIQLPYSLTKVEWLLIVLLLVIDTSLYFLSVYTYKELTFLNTVSFPFYLILFCLRYNEVLQTGGIWIWIKDFFCWLFRNQIARGSHYTRNQGNSVCFQFCLFALWSFLFIIAVY